MRKIGLALAGGGGRGAYHIGVWKALRETGLDRRISAVSGTSVGALNAVLFLQGDLEKAEEIWANMSHEKILTPRHRSGLGNGSFTDGQAGEKYVDAYLFSRKGLVDIMHNSLDMGVFEKSDKNCYVTCKRMGGKKTYDYEEMTTSPDGSKETKKYVKGKAEYFNMKWFSDEDRIKILLATSAMPVIFQKEKIGNDYYRDGGPVDNLPVEPLYRLEKCDIIILVHLTTNERLLKIKPEDFPDARILEIRPREEQGGPVCGILDFTPEGARRRMEQGYCDTIEMCRNIEGYMNDRNDSMEQKAKRELDRTNADSKEQQQCFLKIMDKMRGNAQ